MWIPIDTRLHEHPTVLRIAVSLKLPAELVVGLLARLWGMCSDFDSWAIPGDEAEVSQHYRLPAGFIRAMESVGLAKVAPDSVTITMTAAISDTADRRRERASRAARARWDARNGEHDARNAQHDAQTCSADARNAQSCSDAIEGMDRGTRKKKGNGSQASSPPPALEGAGGLSAAAAMREAMSTIGAAPPAVRPNPLQALTALKEAS
jgi:hypothetical protein